jgi:hypothetical protein
VSFAKTVKIAIIVILPVRLTTRFLLFEINIIAYRDFSYTL